MQRKERIKVMKAWSESGLTKVAFCATKDINYGTFLSCFQQEKRLAEAESLINQPELWATLLMLEIIQRTT